MLSDLAEKFEAASKTYAAANGVERDPDWFLLKLQEEMGELTQAWNRLTGRGRAKGRSAEDMKTSGIRIGDGIVEGRDRK